MTEGVPPAVMAAADRAKAEAHRVTEERRAHRRVPGASLDWIEVARVKYGPEVNIVDLSRGGVLLESDRPLAPGSRQALEIAGPERSIVVPFGVLRSRISALAPQGAVYRAACAFSRPLELPELAAATVSVPPAAEQANAAPAPAPVETPAKVESLIDSVVREARTPDPAVMNGCQRIVARFLDGTILKGFNVDFDVNRPSFSLLPTPDAGADGVSVPLTNLKAVFFVRDFAGNAEYRERKTFIGQTQGRRIHLTFTDGEMIIGTTQSYRAGGIGFFVTPVDPRATNARVFVLSSAVKQVRFP